MADPKLKQFKLLCFDVYGTLVDWGTGIYDGILPLLTQARKPWSQQEALVAYESIESDLQARTPTALYSVILAESYCTLAKHLNLPENDQLKQASRAFADSVRKWPMFADTITALARLSKHFHLVVLSNVDRESFSHTQKILEQGFKFDLVITAQDVGSYKPNPANFEHMLEIVKKNYGVEKHEVLVTAQSLFHDHHPANGLGIATSWIARQGSAMGVGANATYIFSFPTLGDMADALETEISTPINPAVGVAKRNQFVSRQSPQ